MSPRVRHLTVFGWNWYGDAGYWIGIRNRLLCTSCFT
jgi:hypothetical protein